MKGVGEILENCLTKWLTQLCDYKEEVNPTFAQLVSVTCNTLSQYYSVSPDHGQRFADSVLARQYRDCTARLTSSSPFLTSRLVTTRDETPGLSARCGRHTPRWSPPPSPSPNSSLSNCPPVWGPAPGRHPPCLRRSELSLSCLHLPLTQLSLTSHLVSSLATAFSLSTLIQPRDESLLQSLFSQFLVNSSGFAQLLSPVDCCYQRITSTLLSSQTSFLLTGRTSPSSLSTTPASPEARASPSPLRAW